MWMRGSGSEMRMRLRPGSVTSIAGGPGSRSRVVRMRRVSNRHVHLLPPLKRNAGITLSSDASSGIAKLPSDSVILYSVFNLSGRLRFCIQFCTAILYSPHHLLLIKVIL